jgi:hypothetical protein
VDGIAVHDDDNMWEWLDEMNRMTEEMARQKVGAHTPVPRGAGVVMWWHIRRDLDSQANLLHDIASRLDKPSWLQRHLAQLCKVSVDALVAITRAMMADPIARRMLAAALIVVALGFMGFGQVFGEYTAEKATVILGSD